MKSRAVLRQNLYLILLVHISTSLAICQYKDGCDIDFGRGYVHVIGGSNILLDLFATALKGQPPFARFFAGTTDRALSFSLTSIADKTRAPMDERIIEVSRGDDYGLPVLSFSADSLWAKISLDCRKQVDPPSAWLNLNDARNAGASIESWSNFFRQDWAVVFLCDSMMRFFSQPLDSTRIFPTFSGDPRKPDYCMRVLRITGIWMEVYLESPSTFMTDPDSRHVKYSSSNPPPKVWIKFLDAYERPLIWYLWD